MNPRTRSIIDILKRPAEYSVERVSRALTEILEITREYYQPSGQLVPAYATGGEQNGE